MPRELAEILDRHVTPAEELKKMQVRNAKHYLSERATKEDVLCLDLGRCGFTHDAIAASTNMTRNAVTYRLKMAGIKTSDYRQGQSELAKKIIQFASEDSKRYFDTLVSTFRKYLKEG